MVLIEQGDRASKSIATAEVSGMMPLDVMLECMRKAWARNDFVAAASAAAQAAPYVHPRLHSVEAKQETTILVASADELRQRAREAIRQAFSERPMLTAPQIIEHDPNEDNEELKSDDS